MNWLVKFLEALGIAICAVIPAASPTDPQGLIAQISEPDEAGKLHAKHVMLDPLHRETFDVSVKKRPDLTAEPVYSNIIPFSQSPGAVLVAPAFAVPVLDQGQYGTCVTFATTAALDMMLGVGNAIDQQCSLELDLALGNNYWNGANVASDVLNPLQKYGAVRLGKCNAKYPSPNAKISLSSYAALVDKSILVGKVEYVYYPSLSIADVKAALGKGHVVALGFQLQNYGDPVSVQGFNAVVGGNVKVGGLWACQQPNSFSNYCGSANAGHEVVVIGYDDAQQLLEIRNSWGASVADSGNFYMSYTYFGQQVIDGTEIYQ